MQRKLADLEKLIEAFVQRDLSGALVLGCSDVETLYLSQLLSSLDERAGADLYLTFDAPVPTVATFVTAVADSLALRQDALDAGMRAVQRPLPAPLPPLTRDISADPIARMHALVDHALSLLPPGDHHLVWSLVPATISDKRGFGALAEAMLQRNHPRPLRIILRDDLTAPHHLKLADAWPDERVLAHAPGMVGGDVEGTTADTARDLSRPTGERMQALLQLAWLDLGHRRLDAAESKFRGLARYYEATGEKPLQALATGGLGDVQRARNELPAARKTYEQGLLLVAGTDALPVTLDLFVATADTCLALAQWTDAEGYYKVADQLASKLHNLYVKSDALESLGVCRLAQRDPRAAAAVWQEVAALCRELDYPKRLASVLGRLADVHEGPLSDHAARDACLKEQADVHARMREEAQA